MKRTAKNPSAILCSDLHLREDTPIGRTDDYMQAQLRKLEFLWAEADKYQVPIFCSGDIFHKAKSSPYLESITINCLPEDMTIIPGQHDLPNHNIDNYGKSSLNVLETAQEALHMHRVAYNDIATFDYIRRIGLIHTMVQKPNDKQDEIIGGTNAITLLRKYPDLDLIVSGDNHKPFIVEYEGRLLVNPGSMMRMTAAQIDHKPRVYLWYAEDNTVEPAYYPIEENVISREHIEIQEQRDERIDAFVSRINDDYEIGLSFEKNLEEFFLSNKIRKPVQDIIWEEME